MVEGKRRKPWILTQCYRSVIQRYFYERAGCSLVDYGGYAGRNNSEKKPDYEIRVHVHWRGGRSLRLNV